MKTNMDYAIDFHTTDADAIRARYEKILPTLMAKHPFLRWGNNRGLDQMEPYTRYIFPRVTSIDGRIVKMFQSNCETTVLGIVSTCAKSIISYRQFFVSDKLGLI